MRMNHQDRRHHKVKCHFGKADYYKHYAETVDNPMSKSRYYQILMDYLTQIHNAVGNEGYTFNLPIRMGKIQLRKIKDQIKVNEDGSIHNKLTINWKATKQLWAENEKAKEKKIKIRYLNEHTNGFRFVLKYIKYNATYKNKTAYKMSINREMRRSTKNAILNNKVDAFLLNHK